MVWVCEGDNVVHDLVHGYITHWESFFSFRERKGLSDCLICSNIKTKFTSLSVKEKIDLFLFFLQIIIIMITWLTLLEKILHSKSVFVNKAHNLHSSILRRYASFFTTKQNTASRRRHIVYMCYPSHLTWQAQGRVRWKWKKSDWWYSSVKYINIFTTSNKRTQFTKYMTKFKCVLCIFSDDAKMCSSSGQISCFQCVSCFMILCFTKQGHAVEGRKEKKRKMEKYK